jgi:hypothetical protein
MSRLKESKQLEISQMPLQKAETRPTLTQILSFLISLELSIPILKRLPELKKQKRLEESMRHLTAA